MQFPRRRLFTAAAGLAATASTLPSIAFARNGADEDERAHGGPRAGLVFTCSNDAAANEVLAFSRGPAGRLHLRQRIATGGAGSGGGLGSQGALALSGCGRYLFVVNAGSHSVSALRLGARGLRLLSVAPCGGLRPISVAESGGLVYVLNAGGAGGVAGFANLRGRLLPIAGSARPLSAAGGTAPAQVGFSDDGDTLIVAERATNLLTTYRVTDDGSLGAPQPHASAGMTPFGFAVDKRGTLLVSEAAGGAANASTLSSYRFNDAAPQTPAVISAAVPTQQTAACWVAVTPNGRHAYTTNTGSGSVSLFHVGADGRLALAQAAAAFVAGSGPLDAAVSADGRWLHVLHGPLHALATYRIAADGTLTAAGSIGGLPIPSAGLVAS